jgi:N-acetyl-alpha-D-muramate 1-phosphate uridylyltransferase
MKAMILAAGRGERLRPLTDSLPKPLLPVAGKPVIQYTIESLVAAGFRDIVINLAYLGHAIRSELGNGDRFGARLYYSDEGDTGLETAGGIIHALPLLGTEPFLVVNGDIMTDYPYARLRAVKTGSAYLVVVANPAHHSAGDFAIEGNTLRTRGDPRYTFSGIGVYSPEFFAGCPRGKFPLAPLLREAMEHGRVRGEFYAGFWMDLGTAERFTEAEGRVKQGRMAINSNSEEVTK